MIRLVRHLMALLLICGLTFLSQAQPATADRNNGPKPYKILTSGKQITIKATRDISSLMVWSADGNRIVEQKDINNSSYTFRITNNEKVFFVMVKLNDGKVYSEKIGIQ
jgi:hypothetical protein